MIESLLDDPVVTVHVPPALRRYTQGADETTVSGVTVGEALASLGREHPGILSEVMAEDGSVRAEFELFLGGTPVRELAGLETPIGFEELLAIVPAKQGV
jgi:molybdopterin converting factor small subunit